MDTILLDKDDTEQLASWREEDIPKRTDKDVLK